MKMGNMAKSNISNEDRQLHKIKRKLASNCSNSTTTPPPPPVAPPTDNNNSAVFGQQLLLALSKARAVGAFDNP